MIKIVSHPGFATPLLTVYVMICQVYLPFIMAMGTTIIGIFIFCLATLLFAE